MDVDTGITSEVFTIKSETRLIDIFNNIINKKSEACLNYIDNLNLDKNTKIVVVGTYFTGLGIVKKLSEKYNNILLIDIYPHLKELLDTPIGGNYKNSINFSTDLELIKSGEVVIDTTGFGGLTVEQSSEINAEVFLIENPVAEDNDSLLKDKNNIHERINAVNASNKAILKTKGINTKTSGTMTLTIGVLTNALQESQKKEGVLYSACEMGFFEEVIFKEKNINPNIQICSEKIYKNLNKNSLIRILENIFSNAFKYSNGDFKVELKKDGTITFSNKSNILDSTTVSKIFNRYFSVENAKESVGIGLAIVKQLVELNNGKIYANYINETFSINITFD